MVNIPTLLIIIAAISVVAGLPIILFSFEIRLK